MIEMNIDALLNRLEETIRAGRKNMIGGLRTVDDRACLECIAQIRAVLPEELSNARVISKDQANIINNAKLQAQQIINQANIEVERLVNEDAIVVQAKEEANKIVNDANNYANELMNHVYGDIGRFLDESENHAGQILQEIQQIKNDIFNPNNGND